MKNGDKGYWKGIALALFCFVVGAGASLFVYSNYKETETRDSRLDFVSKEELVQKQIEKGVDEAQEVVSSLAGLFAADAEVTREEFEAFTSSQKKTPGYSSLFALTYIQVVGKAELGEFEKQMRRERPGFVVFPAGERDEYRVIKYETPLTEAETAIGFDTHTDPVGRLVHDLARDTGRATMSNGFAPLTAPERKVFLVTTPIYRKGLPVETVEERRRAISGFVTALFLRDRFFEQMLSKIKLAGLDLEIYDGTSPTTEDLIFDSNPVNVEGFRPDSGTLTEWVRHEHTNHAWSIFYSYHPILVAGRVNLPNIVLFSGLGFSVMFSLLVFLLFSSRSRADDLAAKMTADLEKFKLAADNASSHIMITDPEGKIVYANPIVEKITGYSHEETIGATPRLWGGQMGLEFYQKLWHQIKFERKPFRGEIKNKRKNGEFYTATVLISPILDEKKELIGFVGLEDDITERIRTQEALRLSEERFRSLVTNSSDVVVLLSREGIYSYVSPAVEKVLGFAPGHFINRDSIDFIHPDDHQRIKTLLAELLRVPGESVKFQDRMMHKDGSWRWVEGVGMNGLEIPGIQALIVNYRDITERKVVEEKLAIMAMVLAEEKARDEALLTSVGEGVIFIDQEGIVRLVNPEGAKLFGLKGADMLGKPYTQLWQVKDSLGNFVQDRPISRVLATGENVSSGDYFYTRSDGGVFPVYITITPVIENGKVIGVMVVFRDISKERSIDIAKSEFVSMASHQLRTPLSAVNWYAEMLLSGDLGAIDQSQKQYLNEIHGASQRMVELVNALLNVSRIDLGTFEMSPEEVEIAKLAGEVIGELKPRMVFKKLEFVESYEPGLPKMVVDRRLTRIIFQNLLSNSIKYTPDSGKVGLALRRVGAGEEIDGRKSALDGVLMTVSDNGYGIPQSQQEKVFTKLFRADNVKLIDPEGTGLGLYIVKSIVTAMSGSIWFESKEGVGSKFFVILPLTGIAKKAGGKPLA